MKQAQYPWRPAAALLLAICATGAQATPQFSMRELSLGWVDSDTQVWVYASAINNHGLVAGTTSQSGLDEKGRLWDGADTMGLIFSPQRTIPRDVNDNGWVVGDYTYPSVLDNKGFLFDGQNKLDLGGLGGNFTTASGINAAGTVVGSSRLANGQARGYRWENGVMTPLSTLGGDISAASEINDQGVIAGTASTAAGTARAVIWSAGNVLDLGYLPGAAADAAAYAASINNASQVTGYARSAQGDLHAFLWASGNMVDLTSGYTGRSYGWDINNQGQVVGMLSPDFNSSYAFYWDGQAHNLNDLIPNGSGVLLKDARGINDQGQIVASGVNGSGKYRAYLLTPVPEPSDFAMMLAGLGLVGAVARHRRQA